MTDQLSAEEVKQLLTRCWMTHDAMWFVSALSEVGIAATNKINKNAIRAMSGLEVARYLKALGMSGVKDFDQLRSFFEGAMSLAIGDFMKFKWEWRPEGSLYVELEKCFAHDGIRRMGVISEYECGIFERIYAWLDVLNVKYTVEPRPLLCMMYHEGHCVRHFKFTFPEA
ncbi:MAG: hypothetical protein KKC37_10420 [Proteobacteria bacterium]|nr:hypothetical protein [Pseudomonadota bacterium]